jgi:hypothetical protein
VGVDCGGLWIGGVGVVAASHHWYISTLSFPKSKSDDITKEACLKMFSAVYAWYQGIFIFWKSAGKMKRNAKVIIIPKIINLKLVRAFLIFSSFHHENMKSQIARKNA